MPPPLRPHLRSSCRSAPNSLPSVMLPFSVVSTTTSGHACKVAAAAAFDCKATSTAPVTAKPPAPPSRLQRRHHPAHACKAASAALPTATSTQPRSRLQSRQRHLPDCKADNTPLTPAKPPAPPLPTAKSTRTINHPFVTIYTAPFSGQLSAPSAAAPLSPLVFISAIELRGTQNL